MFDRRVSIYIKNTNFKAVLNLFVFNLLNAISESNSTAIKPTRIEIVY